MGFEMHRSVAGKTAAFLVAVALLSPAASQPVLSASPLPTEVRGQALFDEGGGTITADSSGSGDPGTLIALSNWSGHYTFLVDNGNDLRVDGGIFSNHVDWYTGIAAVIRCGGSNPCSPATCSDWDPLPTQYGIQMCGYSIYVDHSGGSMPTILSARTISTAGGWQARSGNDIIHADQLAADCVYHPKNLGYPTPWLQETNVCIGAPQIVDPLNDPGNPSAIMPTPDFEALSTCPGGVFPCGPVESPSCTALPGTTLQLPLGTLPAPRKLALSPLTPGGPFFTICPGIYFGGFSVYGDGISQPSVIMLPGTYVMVGGGFTVAGSASITSVSSQGDGVTIYNSGGTEAFSESFPSDTTLIPTTCPPPVGSLCEVTGVAVLNPPSAVAIQAGNPVTYKLTVPKGTFAGAPVPTGTAASFTFYNGSTPIVCEGAGVVVTTTATSLVATCTTRYTKFGSKGITAVYAGDVIYAATGAMKSQEVVPAPSASQDNVDLRTSTAPCASDPVTDPCGRIVLHAPTSGRYSGLLIFQDRAIGFLEGALAVLLQPALGAGACDMTTVSTPLGNQPKFMADGVPSYGAPFNTLPVPDPCGPLGGLSGTIYAPHLATGQPADWDAVVKIMASGLANLRVIAAEIDFTQGNPSHQARFTYAPNPRSTSTVVACSPDPVVYGADTTCTATLTDTEPGGTPSDPTGEVAFTVTTGPGDIAPGSCTLASDGNAETFTSSCPVTYTPSAVGTGTHTVGASYGGSGVHSGSTGSDSVEVVKLDQEITFAPIGPKAYLDADFTIAPTASSGLPVALSASGDCIIDSATSPANVHVVQAGSCTITASQAGNANYNPAPDVARTFTIDEAGITALSPVHAWVSLKNSDDQGTKFDVLAELQKNGTTIETGLLRCVSGIGRAATPGTEVIVPWTFVPATVDKGDVLSLKVSTRIGTITETTKCAGKNSAVGLRLYYDSAAQASSLGATIGSVPAAFTEYLRSDGNVCNNAASTGVTSRTLDGAPTAVSSKCKDSTTVNFSGGNPYKEIGTWGTLGNWIMP